MEEEVKSAWSVVLKYYYSAEMVPASLSAALRKFRDVKNVVFDEKERTIRVSFMGRCDKLAKMEAAAAASGVPAFILNHAHVPVALAPMKGRAADPAKAREALEKIRGVSGITRSGGLLELHADLSIVTMEAIRQAAERGNCQAIVNRSYEFVTCRLVEGETEAYIREIESRRGVLNVVEKEDGTLGIWIRAGLVNPRRDLENVAGFKVELIRN